MTVFSGCGQQTETVEKTNTNNSPQNMANAGVNTSNSISPTNANQALSTVNSSSSSANGAKVEKKNNQPPAKMPAANIGSGGNDFSLLMNARNAISQDKELINGVVIEIKEGNATLNGKVSSEEQKKKAEELVRGVEGIKSVKNNLRISS